MLTTRRTQIVRAALRRPLLPSLGLHGPTRLAWRAAGPTMLLLLGAACSSQDVDSESAPPLATTETVNAGDQESAADESATQLDVDDSTEGSAEPENTTFLPAREIAPNIQCAARSIHLGRSPDSEGPRPGWAVSDITPDGLDVLLRNTEGLYLLDTTLDERSPLIPIIEGNAAGEAIISLNGQLVVFGADDATMRETLGEPPLSPEAIALLTTSDPPSAYFAWSRDTGEITRLSVGGTTVGADISLDGRSAIIGSSWPNVDGFEGDGTPRLGLFDNETSAISQVEDATGFSPSFSASGDSVFYRPLSDSAPIRVDLRSGGETEIAGTPFDALFAVGLLFEENSAVLLDNPTRNSFSAAWVSESGEVVTAAVDAAKPEGSTLHLDRMAGQVYFIPATWDATDVGGFPGDPVPAIGVSGTCLAYVARTASADYYVEIESFDDGRIRPERWTPVGGFGPDTEASPPAPSPEGSITILDGSSAFPTSIVAGFAEALNVGDVATAAEVLEPGAVPEATLTEMLGYTPFVSLYCAPVNGATANCTLGTDGIGSFAISVDASTEEIVDAFYDGGG